MSKQFISIKTSLAAKSLGFNKEDLDLKKTIEEFKKISNSNIFDSSIVIPTQEELHEWIIENYKLFIEIFPISNFYGFNLFTTEGKIIYHFNPDDFEYLPNSKIQSMELALQVCLKIIKDNSEMKRYREWTIGQYEGKSVSIMHGWDYVFGFKPGYFFQVYEDIDEDPIVNEGFLDGLTKKQFNKLAKKYEALIKLEENE